MNVFSGKKLAFLVVTAFAIHFLFIFAKAVAGNNVKPGVNENLHDSTSTNVTNALLSRPALYDNLQLQQSGLSRQAFEFALKGYNFLLSAGKIKKEELLSIIDFGQPSNKKRLYVIDLKNEKLLFNTYVSHGRNSGREMAKAFSNEPESFKSSLGFFITGDTYIGKHGYSLKLSGEEKGINDNALNRAIVMHSAAYVSESVAKMQGYVGRSLGCPALPEDIYKPVIDSIKGGSCLFLYSPDNYYASHSAIIGNRT